MIDTLIVPLGMIKYNKKRQTFSYKGEIIKTLTTKENEIIKILSTNLFKTVEREKILCACGSVNDYFASRSLDVYISKLRAFLIQYNIDIKNVHGVGYKMFILK